MKKSYSNRFELRIFEKIRKNLTNTLFLCMLQIECHLMLPARLEKELSNKENKKKPKKEL